MCEEVCFRQEMLQYTGIVVVVVVVVVVIIIIIIIIIIITVQYFNVPR